jgi:hypothetical protein
MPDVGDIDSENPGRADGKNCQPEARKHGLYGIGQPNRRAFGRVNESRQEKDEVRRRQACGYADGSLGETNMKPRRQVAAPMIVHQKERSACPRARRSQSQW